MHPDHFSTTPSWLRSHPSKPIPRMRNPAYYALQSNRPNCAVTTRPVTSLPTLTLAKHVAVGSGATRTTLRTIAIGTDSQVIHSGLSTAMGHGSRLQMDHFRLPFGTVFRHIQTSLPITCAIQLGTGEGTTAPVPDYMMDGRYRPNDPPPLFYRRSEGESWRSQPPSLPPFISPGYGNSDSSHVQSHPEPPLLLPSSQSCPLLRPAIPSPILSQPSLFKESALNSPFTLPPLSLATSLTSAPHDLALDSTVGSRQSSP